METIGPMFYERRKVNLPFKGTDRRMTERRVFGETMVLERRRLASRIRRFEREVFHIPVRLGIGNHEGFGYMENISAHGLLVVVYMPKCDPVPSGMALDLQFSFSDVCYFKVPARAVYDRNIGIAEGEIEGTEGLTRRFIGMKYSLLQEWEKKVLMSIIDDFKHDLFSQKKSLLKIIVPKDDEVYSLFDRSLRTPFLARVARYTWPKELRAQGAYTWMRAMESANGPRVKRSGREMINLTSCNYLGLATHPKVKEAAREAIDKFGIGGGASRVLGGTYQIHEELESKLAHIKGGEACLVFGSGYMTNVGTLGGILGKDDVAILDRKDHASIQDGVRLSRCRVRIFDHNDMTDLERVLNQCGRDNGSLIVVESIYSMDGDIADLPTIHRLAKEYNAVVMIDEAHATGVLGATGKGAIEHFGLKGKIDIIMGTLDKALGSMGGFIVGSRDLIDYLLLHAKPFSFSGPLPVEICASVLAAIEILESEPELVTRLWRNAKFMTDGLRALGYDTGDSAAPIIPVMVGEELKANQLTKRLEDLNIFACAVPAPAIDPGRSIIRITVMASHTEDDLREALSAFERTGRELGVI